MLFQQRVDAFGNHHFVIPRRPELLGQPHQTDLNAVGFAAIEHFLEQRRCGAQPAQPDAHLMNAIRIGMTDGDLVARDMAEALEAPRSAFERAS